MIIGSVLLGITLLDSQGYRELFIALFAMTVGPLLVSGLRTAGIRFGRNQHFIWITGCLLIVLVGQLSSSFIRWDLVRQTLQTGRLAAYEAVTLGQAIRPYTSKQDTILSGHELIWEFHEPDDMFYAVVAESPIHGLMGLGIDDPMELWQHMAPSVVIDLQQRMELTDSLRQYMDKQGFKICHSFMVLETEVVVYRTDCDLATAWTGEQA
jgi:hypothetical protein